MPRTGSKCQVAGDYKADCSKHDVQRRFEVGTVSPLCPRSTKPSDSSSRAGHVVDWNPV